MVMLCSLPVPRSLADTWTMPFAVDVELNLNLRHAAGRGSDAGQLEAAQRLIVGSHLALALQHVNLNSWSGRRQRWRRSATFRSGWRCCGRSDWVNTPPIVSMPRLSGVTSIRTTSLTSPPITPPCMAAPTATHSSGLMPLEGFLAGDALYGFLNSGDTGGAADQNYLIDLGSGQASVAQSLIVPGRWSFRPDQRSVR